MKRIFRFAAGVSATAALLVSCNKEEAPQPQDQPVEEVKTKTVNVVGTMSGDATKVTFADGTGFAWEQVDLTSMAIASSKLESNGQADSKYNAQNFVSKEGSIDGGKAYFTFEVPEDHTEGYLFYPNVQVGWYEIHFQFPAEITQAEAGTTNNLKLISEKIDLTTATGSEAVDAKFHINGHLLRYFIYDSEGSEVAVKSVTLKANTNIAGQYTVRPEGPEAVGGSLSTKATVTLTTPYALAGVTSTAQASSIYMPIIPATSEGYTYQVATEAGDIYEFESTKSKTWEDGAITEIALNLSKATNIISSSDVRKKELVFEFTNKGVAVLDRSFAYSGGTANTDYFIVMVDGQEVVDYGSTYYNDFRYEVVDALGNAQDWVAANRSSNNSFDIVCQANGDTEARSAAINIYFDDTEEYEVVGTYKTLDKQYTAITCADPILTLTITQEGKPELPDGPMTLDFHFADKNQTNTIPLELAFPIGGEHRTMAQGHTVEINGVEQPNPFTAEYTFKVVDEDGNEVTDQSIVRPYVYSKEQINIQVGNNSSNPERTFYVHMYFSNFDESQYRVNSTVKSAVETVNATHFQGNLAGVYAADGKTEVTAITDPKTDPVYTVKIVQAGIDLSAGPLEIVYLFSTDKFGSGKGVSKFDYSVGSSASSQSTGWYAVAIGTDELNQTADGTLPYFKNLRYEAVDADGNSITWLSGAQVGNSNESRISWSANETGAERTGYVKLYLDPTDAYKVVGTYTEERTFIPLEPNDAVATFTIIQAAQ